jgi:hypothetical protein
MEVLDVRSALGKGQFDFQRRGQELRISWFSTSAIDLKANDLLFELELAASSHWTGDLQIGGLSEAANGLAEAYPMVKLRLPRLQSTLAGQFAASVYPNPANEQANLSYQLPENGKVSIRITDALGRTVLQLLDRAQMAGRHELSIASREWAAGTYQVQLMFEHEGQVQMQQMKLQLVR